MKIIFIGGRDFNQSDGIANYMFNLATHLVIYGHEPVVFCESDRNEIEYINGFKVIHQKSPKSAALSKILLGLRATLFSLINEKDAVLFHYNGWGPSLISSWLPICFGKRTVIQGHGLEWKRTKYSPRQQRIMKFMEWYTARMNKKWTMVSQEQTDYFLQNYNRKCVTIPCAVNIPSYKFSTSKILERFDLQNDGFFLYLGRLVQEKNPDYLIKAYISSNINNTKLVIAGGNDSNLKYVNYLHKLAEGFPNIIFTGAVYGEDKETLLRNCLAFCIPSTLEGLPIALLEAMSYSKICLASDISANKEALGDSGIWVKAENIKSISDQLNFINDNTETIEWQKNYNLERVIEKFTWDKITKQYIVFMKSFVK